MDLPGAGAHESGAAEDLELCSFAWLSDRAHAQLHEQFLAVGDQVSRLFPPLRALRPGLTAVAPVCILARLHGRRSGSVASALECRSIFASPRTDHLQWVNVICSPILSPPSPWVGYLSMSTQ